MIFKDDIMNSLSTIKVALEVEDFYLRAGLKIILTDFFYRRKQEVFLFQMMWWILL